MKFDIHVKNIRKMKFNGYIFNFTPKNELHEKFENSLQTSLERNFVHLIYIYIWTCC